MYKCTECGMEFEIKPEYCDCGNDEFVLTVDEKQAPEPDLAPAKEPSGEELRQSLERSFAEENKTYTKEPYKLPVSPFAIGVFAICLVLSFLILFFWNPITETPENSTKTEEIAPSKDIPSIDKLWKTTVPAVVPPKVQEAVTQAPVVKKATNTAKPAAKPVAKQSTTVKKVTKTQKAQKAQQTQPAKTTVNNAAQQKQDAAKKAEQERLAKEAAAKQAAEAAKKKAEAEALAAAEAARKTALAKQELLRYKINLRNAIGKKIDFTRVIGDGDCAVTFKVDSTGRLINRAFSKQSTNITLNNAVYNAVMATPTYSAPPSGYKNETLKLNISFKNGNFAITLE